MKIIKAPYKTPGGIHPAYHKDLARESAIEPLPMPPSLFVSMSQHLGAPAKPLVKKGDAVLRGQLIGESQGFISANVHAPTSGKVKSVADLPGTAGLVCPALEIEPDGEDRWVEGLEGAADVDAIDPKDIVARVADAGIAGMGGAGFPTHVKLSPPPGKTIDTLIVNGAECEPYLTADYRLMLEHADRVCSGVQIIRRAVNAGSVWIAIEDNKPEAVRAMETAMHGGDDGVGICVLKTEYPQGAEKQQILAVTGREVPSGGLPMDVGALVENVGTAVAVWDAVANGRPLTERITTVTGTPVRHPSNILARIGTPFGALIEHCGGLKVAAAKLIAGGPMMGLAQDNAGTATTKTTSGLLALPSEAVSSFSSMPCIACGRCVEACPMQLVPSELSRLIEAEDYDAAAQTNVVDCIECGCCAFVCPARRPMVQHLKRGKSWVMMKRREAAKKG